MSELKAHKIKFFAFGFMYGIFSLLIIIMRKITSLVKIKKNPIKPYRTVSFVALVRGPFMFTSEYLDDIS